MTRNDSANWENSKCRAVSGALGIDSIIEQILESWDHTAIFDISGVAVDNIPELYGQVASRLGTIRAGYSANNLDTKFSLSRDIKPTAAADHFFCATTRQPLHNDVAYLPSDEAGEWLILYCMRPSDLGGNTRVISVETLREIMLTYAPDLLENIQTDVFWRYEQPNGVFVHAKPILGGENINWNFWQIDRNENKPEVIKTCEYFFEFLEKKIANGKHL